ncbi:DUF6496 domain-containing protein [Pedomonas mirosovicensis]|uniref:DUF6496 domain-containing protein n=1 Tax=Pedomonas mirosovicensis TaxID=2908641 RepID=UPI002168176F|nr:DUF6496 domain-containing protein [Pedomonas mirosovicensis]MCH8686193.1 DUF6496 domain-containing protein [Pedomonas mirosovicensis]
MAKQSKDQKETVERVMHEFKHGELETSHGRKVKNPRQAIAIGLSEAGASNQQSPEENRERLRETKARERKGETSQQQQEGGRQSRASDRDQDQDKGASRQRRASSGQTKAELYEKARQQDVPGRSRMSKAELEKAVR